MDAKNKFYNELVAMLRSDHVPDLLGWMAAHGSSVILNWGEDNNQWECSWITGGNRFTAVRARIVDSIKDVLGSVRNEMLESWARDWE